MSYEYMTGMGLDFGNLTTKQPAPLLTERSLPELSFPEADFSKVDFSKATFTPIVVARTVLPSSTVQAVTQLQNAKELSSTTKAQIAAVSTALVAAQAVRQAASNAAASITPSSLEGLRLQLVNKREQLVSLRVQWQAATTESAREEINTIFDRVRYEITGLEQRIAVEETSPQELFDKISRIIKELENQIEGVEAAYARTNVPSDRKILEDRRSRLLQTLSQYRSRLERARATWNSEQAAVPDEPRVVAPRLIASSTDANLRRQIEQYKLALERAREQARNTAIAQRKAFQDNITSFQQKLATAGTTSSELAQSLQAQIAQLQQDKVAAETASLEQIQTLQSQIQELDVLRTDTTATAEERMLLLQGQIENLTQQLITSQDLAEASTEEAEKAEAVVKEVVPWYQRYKWHLGIGALVIGGFYYMRNQ